MAPGTASRPAVRPELLTGLTSPSRLRPHFVCGFNLLKMNLLVS